MSYFRNIQKGIATTLGGMKLTMRHFWNARNRRSVVDISSKNYFEQVNGMMTLQFPHETMPVPDNGRYQLHNEMDDCIVCDKCAKICPVDCIEIEPIKATEEVGRASDGSPIRLYAAKFDIDMAKCCYCGLCTTVCPTECLTMTNQYDFSTFDIRTMLFNFGNLTPEKAEEKRQLWEQYQQEKEALKAQKSAIVSEPPSTETAVERPKPAFKPTIKPTPVVDEAASVEEILQKEEEIPTPRPKPVFKPTIKPTPVVDEAASVEEIAQKEEEIPTPRPKPVFKPTIKPTPVVDEAASVEAIVPKEEIPTPRPKPVFKPTMKPKTD